MSAQIYSHDAAFAALCIFEEMLDPQLKDAPRPWNEYWNQVGVSEMREVALELAAHADAAWNKAYARYEAQREQPGIVEDPGCFDYDFVPVWLRHCVEWPEAAPWVRPRVRNEAILDEARRLSADSEAEPAPSVLACPECGDSFHLCDRADARYDPAAGEWVVGDREGNIDCTQCDWSGPESDLVRVSS